MSEPQSNWQQSMDEARLPEATEDLRQASDRTKEVEARLRAQGVEPYGTAPAHSTLPYLHPEEDPLEIKRRAALTQAMVEEERRQFRDKVVIAALPVVLQSGVRSPFLADEVYEIADALLAERDRRGAQQV